jgi:hypothetical protein
VREQHACTRPTSPRTSTCPALRQRCLAPGTGTTEVAVARK